MRWGLVGGDYGVGRAEVRLEGIEGVNTSNVNHPKATRKDTIRTRLDLKFLLYYQIHLKML